MNYSTLEDAYGTPFKQRAPITERRKDAVEQDFPAKPEFTSIEKVSQESIRKNQSVVDSLEGSLPLDRNPMTENFVSPCMERREKFTQPPQSPTVYYTMDQADKLNRILRLVEQNRTGYERPAIQDIALYVFTGVFFLFTFDTFVELGRSMR